MKVIIIEGIDNTGKTTLINRLTGIYKTKYNVMYLHCGACPDFVEFAKRLNELHDLDMRRYEGEKETLTLVDRAWTGEYVYGPIYRNKSQLDVINMFFEVGTEIRKKFKCPTRDFYEVLLYASPAFAIRHDDKMSLSSDFEYNARIKRILDEVDSFKKAFKINPLFLNNDHRKEINVEIDEYNFKSLDDIVKELNLPEEL